MTIKSLYEYTGKDGSFRVADADTLGPTYFPLVNESGLLSAVAPDLAGDIKTDQHTFLTQPVSIDDLHSARAARNFWLVFPAKGRASSLPAWSVTGRSTWQKAFAPGVESATVDAGFLWHRLTRANRKLGVEASTLSFIPVSGTVEIMMVEVKNIGRKTLTFEPVAAVPLYGRSADNLRDHRHVTSLLHRVAREPHGVVLRPTMSFNERGHQLNGTSYFVVGAGPKGAPKAVVPTVDAFIGAGGDFERPLGLIGGAGETGELGDAHQGREAMGALRFAPVTLKPGKSETFVILLGIDRAGQTDHSEAVNALGSRKKVLAALREVEAFWRANVSRIRFDTGDLAFNQWVRWVQVQPTFRKIFGCSFLPDFDYGRGGRGWRDLWQDCLALLLAEPDVVRGDIVRNFGGVRIDGSNATIIGRRRVENPANPHREEWLPEFIADRNNITRTWMDHGIWPFLTAALYLHQTGDWAVFLEKAPYFRDAQLHRGRKYDVVWAREASGGDDRLALKTRGGARYEGTLIEHVLVQTLVQFFNVGEHNIIRLEDADWNDGLDMAHERGESAAFTALYAGNLETLADLIETGAARGAWSDIRVAEEIRLLLDDPSRPLDFGSIQAKTSQLAAYFSATEAGVSGETVALSPAVLAADLRRKAAWIRGHLNRQEWLEHEGHGWYNGYYDNKGRRVEGPGQTGRVRMTLTGQVYPIMAGVAPEDRCRRVVQAVNEWLFDHELGGIRLNTDFGGLQPDLGRAFSFSFGEKENGAVFSHMVVMYANALYRRGFAAEGWAALRSLFRMAAEGSRSRIYPGLPEYFNNEARGRYAYLTGSASWYVLTLLTQAFGVRGEYGDLVLAPQLEPDQFDRKGVARVECNFGGVRVRATFCNPKRLPAVSAAISRVEAAGRPVSFTRRGSADILIARADVVRDAEFDVTVWLDSREA